MALLHHHSIPLLPYKMRDTRIENLNFDDEGLMIKPSFSYYLSANVVAIILQEFFAASA